MAQPFRKQHAEHAETVAVPARGRSRDDNCRIFRQSVTICDDLWRESCGSRKNVRSKVELYINTRNKYLERLLHCDLPRFDAKNGVFEEEDALENEEIPIEGSNKDTSDLLLSLRLAARRSRDRSTWYREFVPNLWEFQTTTATTMKERGKRRRRRCYA